MGTLKTIRAFLYLEKSVPVKEKGRERQKKRDSDTERAQDCPKRHANCGPSLPVSIPTLDDSFAQVYVAQIAQIQSVYHFPFRRSFWSGAWRRLSHIESKVGQKSGANFFIICAGRKSLLFWRNYRFYGLCIFKCPTEKCIRRVFFVATTLPRKLSVITPVLGAQKGKKNQKKKMQKNSTRRGVCLRCLDGYFCDIKTGLKTVPF